MKIYANTKDSQDQDGPALKADRKPNGKAHRSAAGRSLPHRPCRAAGIHYNTLLAWEKKGESEKSGEYVEFLDALQGAEADAVITNVKVITTAAQKGDWRAAAWFLEHKHPELWARLEKRQLAELQANIRAQLEAEISAKYWEQRIKHRNEVYELTSTDPKARRAALDLIDSHIKADKEKKGAALQRLHNEVDPLG